MSLFALHVPEQYVGGHRLRNEVGRAQQLLQRFWVGHAEVEQVLPGGENADDVIHVLLIYREAGQAGGADGVQNGLLILIQGQGDHIGAVDHHVLGGHVVKLEDVFDELLLVALDGARLLALFHHGHNIVLRDSLAAAQQTQSGPGQQGQVARQADEKQNGPYLVPRHGNSPLIPKTYTNTICMIAQKPSPCKRKPGARRGVEPGRDVGEPDCVAFWAGFSRGREKEWCKRGGDMI